MASTVYMQLFLDPLGGQIFVANLHDPYSELTVKIIDIRILSYGKEHFLRC